MSRRVRGRTAPDRTRVSALTVGLLVALAALSVVGCTPGPAGDAADRSADASSAAPAPVRPSRAATPPRPPAHGCYRLTDKQALMPTTEVRPTPCRRPHTALTFAVGTLDTVVEGHLVAVDARRVRAQVAEACPRRLPAFLGGTAEQLRLSTLRAVWFSPTLDQSDQGQSWFRCDVVAVRGDGSLAPLTGRLRGILGRPADRAAYAVCGTAEPGTPRFARVLCGQAHSWRAIASYDVPGAGADQLDYPGPEAVRALAEERCQAAGREVAADPLSFQWGYDWPTADQWAAGTRYGLCWAPA